MAERERTALIIPPSPFLIDERVFPFLGVLKVAAVLEQESHLVDVIDLSGIGNYSDVIKAYMEGKGGRVRKFGITATTPQFPQAVRIRDTIKEASPESKVIIGGAHATMVGSAHKEDRKRGVKGRGSEAYEQMVGTFDVSVFGDGEKAIFAALKDDSPSVIDAGSRDSIFFLQKGTLEQYPFPDRDLIDIDSYHYQIDGKDSQSMIAQLGCPFKCGFCGGRNVPSFRVARTRSPESILAEVDVLVGKYNKEGIMFYDDELNISDSSLLTLLESLIKYQEQTGKELRLRGFVKAELFTPEQAELMYKAGFRMILSGVESGDDKTLETMNKHTTTQVNSLWVEECHKVGLKCKALMSLGHPGETRDTVKASLEWVLKNKPDDVDWTIITQYPGSPYFDESVPHPTKAGVWVYTEPRTNVVLFSRDVNYAKEASYYKGIPGDYTSYVWTESLSPQELVALRDWCESVSRRELGLPPIKVVTPKQYKFEQGNLSRSILRSSDENR